MSTDYVVEVHRKVDDKKIAEFVANLLKCIMDSEFSNMIHCEGRRADNEKFTCEELEAVEKSAIKKIDEEYSSVFEKKLLMPRSKNVEVMREYQEDILCLKDSIVELRYVASAAAYVQGMIACVTEDLYKKNTPAYEYNGKDLPKETHKYANGEMYECSPTIWTRDVYCVIKAY